ncbi:hypothetical protein HPB50_020272 [Hyalomma asiaticum]|uniref:Uncharacterized protein n=1 Tax=Hyalomma asiaticum TaxID=266040 RepID=A0ACB7RJY9_HYAAI|nr:hypothetical protein HPB50_020272 [Hyalomma asiaticum]
MARKFPVAVLLGVSLLGLSQLVSSQQRPQQDCYPDSVSQCYRMYYEVLWGQFDGNYDRICRNVSARYRCHQKIASCPEPVRTNFSRQEEGYEALRDLVCDRKAFEAYRTAARCRDMDKVRDCEEQNGATPEENRRDPDHFGCKLFGSTAVCFDESFLSNCKMDEKSAKAAFMKGQNVLLALEGCSPSAASHVFSQWLVLCVAAAALLRLQGRPV